MYREFLHVEDLAAACLFLMDGYSAPDIVNIGTGTDVTIKVGTSARGKGGGYYLTCIS